MNRKNSKGGGSCYETNTFVLNKNFTLNKTKVDTKFTDNIKGVLKVGNVSTSVVSSSDVDITIILGKDYNK